MNKPSPSVAKWLGAGATALLLSALPLLEGTRLMPYRDPIGILTECNGHTGSDVVSGRVNTPSECQQKLEADVIKHAADVMACIKVPLTQGQTAAFVSFAFNVGGEKFCMSTLAIKANAGDFAGACAELSRWTLAGGKELPGLVKRRALERAWCEGTA
jgi:lysozyme